MVLHDSRSQHLRSVSATTETDKSRFEMNPAVAQASTQGGELSSDGDLRVLGSIQAAALYLTGS